MSDATRETNEVADGRGSVQPEPENERGDPIDGLKKGQVVVRMYCTGLGDCFLLAFRDSNGETAYLMIDCGVFRGTFHARDWMTRIMAHIRGTVGDRGIDVLVISHQHWDHISGFSEEQAQAIFRGIKVKQVWMPWTEEPGNPQAAAFAQRRRMMIAAAAAAARRLAEAGDAQKGTPQARQALGLVRAASNITGLMAFIGVAAPGDEASEKGEAADVDDRPIAQGGAFSADFLGASRRMEELMLSIANHGVTAKYPKPSLDPIQIPRVPGVKVYVLGPPTDESLLGKDDPSKGDKSEVYLRMGSEAAFFAAGAGGGGSSAGRQLTAPEGVDDAELRERSYPFDMEYRIPAAQPALGVFCDKKYGAEKASQYTAFFRRHYGPVAGAAQAEGAQAGAQSAPEEGGGRVAQAGHDRGAEDWRRIDTDWLMAGSQLALDLDDHVNNTSLALAFEIGEGPDPPVLLFPGDAQVGNWLSWHKLTSRKRRGRPATTAAELLARTVLYKVGHHASHNATLKALGLKLMTRQSELIALVPVDYNEAHKPKGGNPDGWDMPYGKLLEDLIVRTHGRVILADLGHLPGAGEPYDDWNRGLKDHFHAGWAAAKKSGWSEKRWSEFREDSKIEWRLAKVKKRDGKEMDVRRPLYVQLTIEG